MNITLLGDSVFDNGSYLNKGEKTAPELLNTKFMNRFSMLATDGATTTSVIASQIPKIKKNTNKIFVSIGGNDLLGYSHLLDEKNTKTIKKIVANARRKFAIDYETMLQSLKRTRIPIAIFTIYYGEFPSPEKQIVKYAVDNFNRVILNLCEKHVIPVLNLNGVLNSPSDFTKHIEPSAKGSKKLADAIVRSIIIL